MKFNTTLICSNRLRFLVLRSLKFQSIFFIIFIELLLFLQSSASICPASITTQNTITSNEATFGGYSICNAFGVAFSPKSSSFYYMYRASGSDVTIVRKINSDDTLAWMTSVSFRPTVKSLMVDANEKYVFVSSSTNPMNVLRLLATTGAIVDTQTYGSFDGRSDDTKIFTLTDDSGYYVTGKDSSNLANICKYLYSSSLNAQCQQITHFSKFVYGQLKLSDTEFFMLSNDPVTAYPLHFYKFKFSLTSPTWAMSMPCSESVCYTGASESLLSSDSSKIYSFYSFGNLLSLYFTTFVSSDGSILSTRYKSGTYTCGTSGGAYGSVVMDNYIITSFCITYLVIIDIQLLYIKNLNI